MAISTQELLDRALVDLILDFPVFGQLITRIGVKIVNEPGNEHVAWTNGKGIYLNEPAIAKYNENPIVTGESGKKYNCQIGKKQLMFALCHEVMHLLNLTYDRGAQMGITKDSILSKDGLAKWKAWNAATDYEINALLMNNEEDVDGNKRRNCPGEIWGLALYKDEYVNKTAEEIFKELYEENKKNSDRKFVKSDGNGSGNGDDDGDYTLNNKGSQGNSNQGNGLDGLSPMDEHMPILDDATRNEVISKISEVFGSRTNGLGSSAIERSLERTFKPQPFNWKKALTKYIRGFMKDSYTWNKPSRAGIANNLILPSAGKTPKMHIAVAVDTSGSIFNTELQAMMDHLFTILQQFKDFTIDVWCCGSRVYEETLRTYTASNKKELANFEFKSDGGNDMRENFDFLRKHYKADKPDVFICMSDFYDPLDGDKETTSPCPCIWLVLDHPDFRPPSKIKAETYPFVVEKRKNG